MGNKFIKVFAENWPKKQNKKKVLGEWRVGVVLECSGEGSDFSVGTMC